MLWDSLFIYFYNVKQCNNSNSVDILSWIFCHSQIPNCIVYFYWVFLRGDNCQFLAFIPEVEIFLRASSSFYHSVHICIGGGTTQTFFSHDWFLGQLKNK